jgi:membrane protease YdiL (CAAX protease family)
VPDPWTTFEPLLPYLLVTTAVLPAMLVLGWYQGRAGDPLFPPQRERATPWGGVEVLGAFLIGQLLQLVVLNLFDKTGLLDWLYVGEPPSEEVSRLRRGLWSFVATMPLQIVATLLLLRVLSDSRPYQLGLTDHRLRSNTLSGLLYWLTLTPAVLLLHLLVSRVYAKFLDSPPDEHDIAKLMQQGGTPVDRLLTVLSAVVVASVVEEFIYRGVLQPWLMRRRYRCDIVFSLSLLLAVLFREAGLTKACAELNLWQFFLELNPALFVLLLLPVHLWLRDLKQSATACGIFNSALFFAIWHTLVWPTPIPLLFLGAVLGYLAWRTQSLVAPIVLHSVFNAVGVVTMFLVKS